MAILLSGNRGIRLPRLMRVTRGVDSVIEALNSFGAMTARTLVVHSGRSSGTGYGRVVASHLRAASSDVIEHTVSGNTEAGRLQLDAAIGRGRPDLLVAVGGGKVVDTSKAAAADCGVDMISVPTQASSDGICSPVAVLMDDAGRPRSLGAAMPVGILVDMEVLDAAPRDTWLSGVGDLVANLSAVRDWRLAQREDGEVVDDLACLTSEAAVHLVVSEAPDIDSPDYRERIVRGLILSGVAMEMAGSSRPASGGEHLIGHALDRILAAPRLHGLQVAVGTITTELLSGDDPESLLRFFRAVGLPRSPIDLGINRHEYLEALIRAPSQRPGRRTLLDGRARSLLEDLVDLQLRIAETK